MVILLRNIRRLACLMLLMMCATSTQAQKLAVKTNLLYGAYTFTPNLGVEIGLGRRITLDISGGYNPWNLKSDFDNNKKLVHWLGQTELRYWFCRRFSGHFLGIHALGSQYNIAGHELPLLFGKDSRESRYEGWTAGAGISYGYQFILGRRWNLELNIGAGYAYMRYDRYNCIHCGRKTESNTERHYFGPTRAGVSLIYIIKQGGKRR